MDLKGKVAVVTGAASGIGRAAVLRFRREGCEAVVGADLAGGEDVTQCDVARESDVRRLVADTEARHGRVDVFFSNAGILRDGGIETPDEEWLRNWQVHVMAHVYAARAVAEKMIARGGGYFLVTGSAAGLLNIVESATYGTTEHAAVALAEWLRIAYGRRGLRVSCLCPQAVQTGMIRGEGGSAGVDGVLTAEQVMDEVVAAMRDERFLILPHPQVLGYLRNKANDYDRWLGGMQKVFLRHGGGR